MPRACREDMKQLAITLGALLLSGSAWADTHQTGKITKLVVESTFVSVWLEGQPTNNECASDGRWTIDLASDKSGREKYAAILSAASSRTQIGFHALTSEGCGVFGAKKIYSFDLAY